MSPNISALDFIHLFEIKRVEVADYMKISYWRALANLVDALCEPWAVD